MTSARATDTDGRSIGDLIEALRAHGFEVSTSEAIDATQLLLVMARNDPAPDPERLCARLRPLFCKNWEQQRDFDAIFRDWYQVAEAVLPPPPPPPPPPPETAKTRWRTWTVVGVLLLIGTIAAFFIAPKIGVDKRVVPDPNEIIGRGGQSGGAGGGAKFIDPPPPPPPEPSAILGYFPRLRYNHELRPVWGWVLAALPLVALAGFSIPALVIARTRARRRSDPMYLDRRSLEEEARRIVPPLRPEISAKLARHLRGSPEGEFRLTRRPILDVRATIEKTLRNRGLPTPQYRHTHAPPSYLLLIDVANQRDPRGRLFYQWAERLQRERLDVEIAMVRLHEEHPQFAPTWRGELPRDDHGWTSLARLPDPPFGQRLLLVSSGELLVDERAKWRREATAARLHRWRQRAMFTPIEPRDWGAREDAIERSEHTADPGFIVLPLDENALSAWTDLLTTGQLSTVVLSEPQRYPAELRRGRADDFIREELVKDPQRVEKLISQLRAYLGDLGFTWLAALAIPPLVRWELTVLLGRDVIQRLTRLNRKDVDAVLSRNYRRLVRLPWLRHETMPNWLRLRLLAELADARQNELRDVVEHLLGKLSPTPEGEGIALEFDRPPGRDAAGPTRSAQKDSDPLYLGYMSGLTPRQLAMRAPREWGNWLGKVRFPRERGLRGLLAKTADRARSWWARLVFRGGSPFHGLRPAPVALAIILLALAAGFLTLVAKMDRQWWPEAAQRWLFTEEAHAIAFHHAGPVRASFSEDGRLAVTASDDGIARVWDVKTGKAMTPPLRHPGRVVDAKIRATPNYFAVYTASGNVVRIWDNLRPVPIERLHVEPIRRLAVDPFGRFVAVGDRKVRYWHALGTVDLDHQATVNDAALSGDGRVVTASSDGRVTIWDHKGVTLDSWVTETQVLSAAFSRDGRYVVSGDFDGSIRVSGGLGPSKRIFSGERAIHEEFSPDGRSLIAASIDGRARLWRDWSSDEKPLILDHGAALITASFSSDGQRVLTAGDDGAARVWDASTGKAIGSPLRHERELTAAEFSPDGMRIVTASADGTARVWEAVADPPETPALRHADLITAVAFDAAGRRVLTGSWDGTARVWSAETGSQVTPTLRHDGYIWWAEFSPDSRAVATAGGEGTAAIWDSQTGRRTAQLPHRTKILQASIFRARFSSDGRRIVTSGSDGTARIWDATTGLPAGLAMRHSNGVMTARFTPDGTRVVTATENGTVTLWNAQSAKPIGNPQQHSNFVSELAVSANGRLIVSAGHDGTARICDARTGALLRVLNHGEGVEVHNTTFDPQSRLIVTVSGDRTARLWDALTGALLHVLQHDDMVFFAAFSPDGSRVATASDDGTARIWRVDDGTLLAPPIRHETDVFRVAFSNDGKRLITGSGDTPPPRPEVPFADEVDPPTSDDKDADKGTRETPPSREKATLPNEYIAPKTSAQIWHVPPWPTPDTSPSREARRRAARAFENLSMQSMLTIAGAAIVVLLLIVALRRGRQLRRLAHAEAEAS